MIVVAALAAGCPGTAADLGGEGAARGAETGSAAESTAPEAPEVHTGARLALVIFDGRSHAAARQAVAAHGGRVLVVWDEPALVVRIPAVAADALAAELEATVSTEPVTDGVVAATAPAATGFWNRRHGVDGPTARLAPPGRVSRPAGHELRRGELGPALELSAALDARAHAHLGGLLECLAEEAPIDGCLQSYVAPSDQERLAPLLAREREVFRLHDLDPRGFSFELRGFDGDEAEYEIQREDRPSGAARLALHDGGWAVTEVDP